MPRGRAAAKAQLRSWLAVTPRKPLACRGRAKEGCPPGRKAWTTTRLPPPFTKLWLTGDLIVLVNHSLCRRGLAPIYSAVQGIKIKKPCSHFCHVPSASPTFNRLHNEAIPGLLALLSLVNNLL